MLSIELSLIPIRWHSPRTKITIYLFANAFLFCKVMVEAFCHIFKCSHDLVYSSVLLFVIGLLTILIMEIEWKITMPPR